MIVGKLSGGLEQPSICNGQTPPPSFQWTSIFDEAAQALVSTTEAAPILVREKRLDRPRVLWLWEAAHVEESLNLALYTNAIREASFTHRQTPPPSIRYTNFYDPAPDGVLATSDMAGWAVHDRQNDDAPKILWLQESRHLGTPPRSIWRDFDLVLSNQKLLVDAGATYMTLFGTWITNWEPSQKIRDVSMIASSKYADHVAGYVMRRQVIARLTRAFPHGYGSAFGKVIADKWDALAPYRFSIAIESENYPWWHTEKLFDCMATRTVPLYWGAGDQKLAEFGYDPRGILWWESPDDLVRIMKDATPARYESMQGSIEHNYQLVHHEYCAEVVLERILREKLGL